MAKLNLNPRDVGFTLEEANKELVQKTCIHVSGELGTVHQLFLFFAQKKGAVTVEQI